VRRELLLGLGVFPPSIGEAMMVEGHAGASTLPQLQ
jgi:hypothetical protein